MSKLVLHLEDGTTLDIPLDHERITIGRRGDNDVCLPNLAVSGDSSVFYSRGRCRFDRARSSSRVPHVIA